MRGNLFFFRHMWDTLFPSTLKLGVDISYASSESCEWKFCPLLLGGCISLLTFPSSAPFSSLCEDLGSKCSCGGAKSLRQPGMLSVHMEDSCSGQLPKPRVDLQDRKVNLWCAATESWGAHDHSITHPILTGVISNKCVLNKWRNDPISQRWKQSHDEGVLLAQGGRWQPRVKARPHIFKTRNNHFNWER